MIVAKPEASKPIDDFTVIFNNKNIVTNDESFIKSHPEIANALSEMNSCHAKSAMSVITSLTVNEEGVVISNNEYYNGKLFVELLINDGGMSYFDDDFTVVFDKNGYKSISNEDVFLKYTNLQNDLVELGNGFINKIPDNEEVTLSFIGNKFYLNGNEFYLFTNLKSCADRYEEFKDCVGEYWWLPGVNVVACGVGALIAEAIDY